MGFTAGGDDRMLTDDLAATVAALVAPLADPDLRAQFTGFAELQSRAG